MRLIFILLLIPLNPLNAQQRFWQRTNGPCGGSIYDYEIDSSGKIYGANSNGIFKSDDNGYNWTYSGLQEKEAMSICRTASGILLAGVYNEGLYRSTDEGINWVLRFSNFYIPDIFEVSNGVILAASSSGVYRSTNQGLNWNLSALPLTYSLAESPLDNKVYAACYNGLFSSTNSGINWTLVGSLNAYSLRAVDISDNGFIYIADRKGSLSRSTDNAVTFTALYKDSIYEPTCVATASGGNVYCGTSYEGIWRSTDYGDTWIITGYGRGISKLKKGLNDNIFASVPNKGSVKTTDNGITWTESIKGIVNVYAGPVVKTLNGRIFSSSGQMSFDDGMNWHLASNPIIVSYSIAVDPGTGYIYAGNGTNQIHRSTDNGDNFFSFNVFPSGYGASTVVVNDNEIFTSGIGLYKSTNDGLNWEHLSNMGFRAFALNKKSEYFGSDINGIHKSTNLGQNWSLVLPLSHMSLAPNNPIMITSEDIIYVGGPEGIFRSTNDGVNWVNEGNLENVSCIVEAANGRIFATCYDFYSVNEGGVFEREGNFWKDMTYNLSRKNVLSMCFSEDGRLIVTTAGSGAFRSINPVVNLESSNTSVISDYELHQNYPNPFNPVTNIQFNMKERNFVTIKIYDSSGKEILILINEYKDAGQYNVTFNGVNLPSGIYFYTIRVSDFVQTKKMLLIK